MRLMADYECWRLWDAEDVGNIDPEKLPLSEPLKRALAAWSAAYDATLNRDDPVASGFPSPAAKAAFEAEGERLLECLRAELPGVAWTYGPR